MSYCQTCLRTAKRTTYRGHVIVVRQGGRPVDLVPILGEDDWLRWTQPALRQPLSSARKALRKADVDMGSINSVLVKNPTSGGSAGDLQSTRAA
jgi:hypothetical protein